MYDTPDNFKITIKTFVLNISEFENRRFSVVAKKKISTEKHAIKRTQQYLIEKFIFIVFRCLRWV